jgi:hypothetical protein
MEPNRPARSYADLWIAPTVVAKKGSGTAITLEVIKNQRVNPEIEEELRQLNKLAGQPPFCILHKPKKYDPL